MAIYNLHVKVIGRKAGSSAVASAAYRSASRLRDARIERVQDFSGKRGVVHSEVQLPDGAPEAWRDRERLWNDVEASELRKDAQLAREVEFALPREMSQAQGIALARDFVETEFVDLGMVADLNVHWDIGEDGMAKPHAHVMLTTRSVDEDGFGPKVREWNATEMVERWRERWAVLANERLAELDIDARIDQAPALREELGNRAGPLAKEAADDPEAVLRRARTRALNRHARAWDAILSTADATGQGTPEQLRELSDARKAFEEVRPHGWRDAEAAYEKNTELVHEAADGKLNRSIRALQLETEIRTDPERRAGQFVERWKKLDQQRQRQYSD